MRYIVKVYTLTEDEERTVGAAVSSGMLRDAERLSGFTQGTTNDKGLAYLVERGLSALSVEEIAGGGGIGQTVRNFAAKALSPLGIGPFGSMTEDFEIERADGRQNYLLARVAGALTPSRLDRLRDAGVQIVERRQGDTYVIKALSSATLKALDFVSDVRTYGAGETMVGPAFESPLPKPLREFEALTHADVDTSTVVGAIASLGAKITSTDDRSVRFALGTADLDKVADLPDVAQLQETSSPRILNDAAQALVGLSSGTASTPLPGLNGAGQIVGVADTGVDETHADLIGVVVGFEDLGRRMDHSDPNGHGTHVTGTIAGSGSASGGRLRGAAPGAKIYFQSLLDANGRLGGLPPDIGTLFSTAYDKGVRIHNNSWGAFLEARYGSNAVQVDRFIHGHQDFLAVIAAGNSGRCASADAEIKNSTAGFVEYPSIATPASAKNGLTVGASRSDREQGGYSRMTWRAMWGTDFPDDPIGSETVSGNSEALAGFSSRGPVDNDVIKPDLVAPGTDVASTRSSTAPLRNFWGAYPSNAAYAFMGGTSMAAPLVAGAAALVRQYYEQRRDHRPSAALVKATLINGTTRLTHVDATAAPDGDPNYHQGFGKLDMARALPLDDDPHRRLEYVDTLSESALDFRETGERRTWTLQMAEPGEIRLCLAWTDFPASGLQNGILLFLDEIGTPRKWVSNQRVPQAVRFPTLIKSGVIVSRDPKNNVQVIRVPDLLVGEYVVSVIASNILFPPQTFALVATGPIARMALR
ncbi:MAG: S8 family serine peptidase [Sphingomonas phyllosphaerae]